MNGQTTRRMVLAALAVMVSGSAAFGAGQGASAKDNARHIGDYGNKAAFKGACEGGNGTFIEDSYGNTECRFPDGSWIECDANGNDCWYTPPFIPAPPSGIPLPPTDGTIVAAPIVDGTTQDGGSHQAAGADDDQGSAKAKQSKHQKGKKRGHRGKGRKH